MDLVVREGARTERVQVEREGERYLVRVGERAYEVDIRNLGPFVRSLLIEGASFETAVFRPRGSTYRVAWRGRTTRIEVIDPLTWLAVQAHGTKAGKARETVTAYMPGRVASVGVAPGDRVEAGQAIVVLEAMKMQNEIQAEHAGIVVRVHVVPGQAVEGGDPMVELESAAGEAENGG